MIGRTRKFSSSRLQAGEQAGAEETRLAGTRSTQDHQHALGVAAAHPPQRIEPFGDLAVTAEEDRGVRLLERAQAAVGRAARFVRGRPGKVSGVETGAPKADPQTA